jgi:phage terminase large subunit-like protein
MDAARRPWFRQDAGFVRDGELLGDIRGISSAGDSRCDRSRRQRRYGRRRERHLGDRTDLVPADLSNDPSAAPVAERRYRDTLLCRRPDRLRGPQHDAALCDELAIWRDSSTWDMLQFGLRLGKNPRIVVATTPRPTKLVRQLLLREEQGLVVTRGTTYENRDNLAPGFFEQIVSRYEGTRLGRQELLAEVLMDVPGALWNLDGIDAARRQQAPDLTRVVVAIDPAVSTNEGSDETGIIVAGKDERGHGYVLDDLSGRYQPADWARTAIEAYRRHSADRIVAEINQGGDMVENTLRTIDPNVPLVGPRRRKVSTCSSFSILRRSTVPI